MTDRVVVWLHLLEGALCPQHLDDSLARLGHRQSVELRDFRDVHPAVEVKDGAHLEVMALPDLVIGDVMPGGNLDRPGAELLVQPVVGMNGDRRVTHHGFGPRRRYRDHSATVDRVVEVVKVTVRLFVLDLEVRDRALVVRTPVDDPWAAIDKALFPKPNEDVADRLDVAWIHGEVDARPVGREAESPHLLQDGVAGGLVPLRDELVPRDAPDLLLRRAFLGQLFLE